VSSAICMDRRSTGVNAGGITAYTRCVIMSVTRSFKWPLLCNHILKGCTVHKPMVRGRHFKTNFMTTLWERLSEFDLSPQCWMDGQIYLFSLMVLFHVQ